MSSDQNTAVVSNEVSSATSNSDFQNHQEEIPCVCTKCHSVTVVACAVSQDQSHYVCASCEEPVSLQENGHSDTIDKNVPIKKEDDSEVEAYTAAAIVTLLKRINLWWRLCIHV